MDGPPRHDSRYLQVWIEFSAAVMPASEKE
jgi:hypothetical protein